MDRINKVLDKLIIKYPDETAVFNKCKNIIDRIEKEEISHNLSVEIGELFTEDTRNIPLHILKKILKHFVRCSKKRPFYVNEIKMHLKLFNKVLYNKYINLFRFNIGANKVFNIETNFDANCPILDNIFEEQSPLDNNRKRKEEFGIEAKIKKFKKNKTNEQQRSLKSKIRRKAKSEAIKSFKYKNDQKSNK